MHRIVIFVILSFCQLPLLSQNSFFKWFDLDGHQVAWNAVQISNGGYLIVGERGNNIDSVQATIWELSTEGEIVNVLEIPCSAGNSRLRTIDKIAGYDHRYLVTGSNDSVSGNEFFSSLKILVINDSLEIISAKQFFPQKNRHLLPCKTQIAHDSVLYLMYEYDSLAYYTYDFGIMKLTIPFDSITNFHKESIYHFIIPQDILYHNNDSTLRVYYFGDDIFKLNSEICIQNITLNKNLEYEKSTRAPADMVIGASAILTNDSTTYLASTINSNYTIFTEDLGSFLVNDTGRVLKSKEYFICLDTLLYGGRPGNSLVKNKQNTAAFYTGIYNLNPEQYPWQKEPSWIRLIRTDFELNAQFQYFYGGDAFYVPYHIIPTNDGGCFVTGFRYDYTDPENLLYNFFVLKTDTVGLIVGTDEISSELISQAILAPTPGSDHCYAIMGQQFSSASLQMFDMLGNLVLEERILGNKTKINTAFLHQGIYIYQIFKDQLLIGKGKWVKN